MKLNKRLIVVVSVLFALLLFASVAAASTTLTLWFWAESDAPGANDWLEATIDKYEKLHSDIKVNAVIQATDTFTANFQAAAAAKSGPDIGMQWATMPVLTQVWNGAVVPISDYVPESEYKHWLNLNENEYNGKKWAASLYMIGVPIAYNKVMFEDAGLDPESPPQTWAEFEDALAKLKASGVTPIGMGNKDGYTGAWMFSNLGIQELDNVNELKHAVLGDADLTKDKFLSWYDKLYDMVQKGYFNRDISSLDFPQGWNLFPTRQVAMSWTTDGNLAQWIKEMGEDEVGVMKTPVFGEGKLAQAFNATQSVSLFITSWSEHKQEAADFIQFLHTQEVMLDWYKRTGVFPADDRFDPDLIESPTMRKLWELETGGANVWLENYIPPEVDLNGDIPAGQLILSRNGTPEDAVALWSRAVRQWRLQHPDEVDQYREWAQ